MGLRFPLTHHPPESLLGCPPNKMEEEELKEKLSELRETVKENNRVLHYLLDLKEEDREVENKREFKRYLDME